MFSQRAGLADPQVKCQFLLRGAKRFSVCNRTPPTLVENLSSIAGEETGVMTLPMVVGQGTYKFAWMYLRHFTAARRAGIFR
jgi:hypothetical protein